MQVTEMPRHKTERSEWIAWRTEAQTKLNTDGRAIGNDQEQFGYLYMHLQTGAQKRIQQWYNMCLKTNTNCNPMAFLERAEGTFGDPNEKKNARTLLSATKQRSDESFSDFITKFEELLAQAGDEEWSQDVQPAPLNNTSRSGQGNWQETADGKAKERAPWASPEERDRRRESRLCLRCGGADHLQKACKYRSAIIFGKRLAPGESRLREPSFNVDREFKISTHALSPTKNFCDFKKSCVSLSNCHSLKPDLAEYNTYDKDEEVEHGITCKDTDTSGNSNEDKRKYPAINEGKKVTQLESMMETEPMMVDIQVNDIVFEEASVDTGNTCYITISEKTALKIRLPTRKLARSRRIKGVSQDMSEMITHISWAKIDVGGYQVQKAY
ncbi:hypothetical protein GcM1_134006, partial [Golovinomyces cichoracearum]